MMIGQGCNNYSWMGINALLCATNIAAAFYIVHKMQDEQAAANAVPPTFLPVTANNNVPPTVTATYVAETGVASGDYGASMKKEGMDGSMGTPYQAVEAQPVSMMDRLSATAPPANYNYNSSNASFDTYRVNGGPNSFHRLGRVLCYDAGVAVYIIIVIIWMFWQSTGVLKLFGSVGGDNGNENCYQTENWQMYSITLGFLWMMLVCCAFSCSLLCLR
jgi:hypothetical protein